MWCHYCFLINPTDEAFCKLNQTSVLCRVSIFLEALIMAPNFPQLLQRHGRWKRSCHWWKMYPEWGNGFAFICQVCMYFSWELGVSYALCKDWYLSWGKGACPCVCSFARSKITLFLCWLIQCCCLLEKEHPQEEVKVKWSLCIKESGKCECIWSICGAYMEHKSFLGAKPCSHLSTIAHFLIISMRLELGPLALLHLGCILAWCNVAHLR